MKKLLLALLAIPVLFAGCNKSDGNSEIYKPSYHVDGIADRIMQKPQGSGTAPGVYLSLSITYENQEQERLTLSLENVPAGLTAKLTPTSGFPTFNSQLTLIDSNVAVGEYTLKLVVTGANSGKKTFEFNLSVQAAPDCAALATGTGFASQLSCSGTGGSFTQNVSAVAGTPGRVIFSNFDNTGIQIYGNVTCNSGQINIPSQTINNATYQGSGSVYQQGAQRYININFYRTVGSSSSSCYLTLTK